ncbi:amino-acid N-acetyltransferase [Echinimonas agarilytica]|uniref:Amino-acid acetyltransferase n=1 Tax=Echinimonas agarilytica TaxID=1215918 RepID=A0AA41W5U4_9GAMM|nr:amino-acid N-acetyltransferase [Echinimonas agarilytica]MCM2679452.1 amino-acid N-acetyltransferase [Echinimonas agarilytica]
MRTTDLVGGVRHSAPYVNAHRGKIFVVMVGGEAVQHPNFRNILNDIALLNTLGIKLVLVFGARPQINAQLEKDNADCSYYRGVRLTDVDMLERVKQVTGAMQLDITARLSMSLSNTPMQGSEINVVTGNFVIAQPIGVIDGIDHCHSGRVRRIDVECIENLLNTNNIVLHGPIAASVTGESFNLTAEEIATQIAIRLQAEKIIGFSELAGVLDESEQVMAELLPSDAEAIIADSNHQVHQCAAASNFISAAIKACRSGVNRSHLVSYQDDGALLQELFSRDGIGTQFVNESAEQMSQADISHIGGILDLIRPLEQQGVLVRRSREQLETELEHFLVVERDGLVIGCVAVYPFADQNCAEFACLAIHPNYRAAQRGDMLLKAAVQRARKMGFESLFALTTTSIHWFLEQGFVMAELEDLPPSKQQLYNLQRRSKILQMSL